MEKHNLDNRSDQGSKLNTYSNAELKRKSVVIIIRKQKTFLWKKVVCSVDSEKIDLWTIIQERMMRFEYNGNMQVKRKDKQTWVCV